VFHVNLQERHRNAEFRPVSVALNVLKDLIDGARDDSTHFMGTKFSIWTNMHQARIRLEATCVKFPMCSWTENRICLCMLTELVFVSQDLRKKDRGREMKHGA